MTFRRKSPPVTELSTIRQLQLLCNATAMGLPFQSHNAQVLFDQLKNNNSITYEQFKKNATRQDFFPSRLVNGTNNNCLITGAPIFTLPLPKHFIDSSENIEDIVQRSFYHGSMIKNASKLRDGNYTPRCGLTGLFFSREEVIDNLQAAAAELEFKSPFWIRSNHPALGNFLQLKDGSEAICLSLTAAVVSFEDLEPFHKNLLHPTLQLKVNSNKCIFGKDVPRGMNALTGFITRNPFVQSLPNRGVWISQEQFLQNNLQFKKNKKNNSSDNPFVLVEVEQWELHNADQLVAPGRLALHHSAAKSTNCNSLFS